MEWPNGEPCSSPAGAVAVTRSPQQAQRPPNSRTWVTSGLIGRQFNALIDLLRGLRGLGERRLTVRASGQLGSTIRSGLGCSVRPTPGRLLRGRAICGGGWEVLLLALRRRLGRIAGGLRRASRFLEPRLQGRDAGVLRGDGSWAACAVRQRCGDQHQDQRILLGVAQFGGVREQRHPGFRIDPPVTVSRIFEAD